ncbi:hypothetical protein, partial [Virgibacillus pantothenticus]
KKFLSNAMSKYFAFHRSLQLPRKAKTAFLWDLQLALIPQESTYFDYAKTCVYTIGDLLFVFFKQPL